MVKQGLEDEIKVMQKQLSEASATRAATEEELHGAQTQLKETQQTLAADEKYLAELKQSCSQKATEWAQRQKSVGEETAAIEKAKGILSDGVKVFLQTSEQMTTTRALAADSDARQYVVSLLG